MNAREIIEQANVLLCNATPSKVLDSKKSEQWCKAFGKWFAEAHAFIHPHPRDAKHRDGFWWMPAHTDPIKGGWFYVRNKALNIIGMRYYDATDDSWWAVQRGEKTLVPNNTFDEWLTIPDISDNQWTS